MKDGRVGPAPAFPSSSVAKCPRPLERYWGISISADLILH